MDVVFLMVCMLTTMFVDAIATVSKMQARGFLLPSLCFTFGVNIRGVAHMILLGTHVSTAVCTPRIMFAVTNRMVGRSRLVVCMAF